MAIHAAKGATNIDEWQSDGERFKTAVAKIMAAQEEAARKDDDFIVLTDVMQELSTDARYLDPEEIGPHYNNAGMQIIGAAAGLLLRKR